MLKSVGCGPAGAAVPTSLLETQNSELGTDLQSGSVVWLDPVHPAVSKAPESMEAVSPRCCRRTER